MTSPKLPPSSHLIYVVMQKRGDGRIYPDMHKTPPKTPTSVFRLHWKEGNYAN